MSERYSPRGLKQRAFVPSLGEIVRGATWVRGGGQIATPQPDIDLYVPIALQISQVVVLTYGGPGSCVIDIWKAPFAAFPPDVGDTITAAAKPTLTNEESYADSTLSGWTTAIAAGDVLRFHLDSSDTFRRISVFLTLRKG